MLGCDLKLLGCDWLTAVVTLQKLAAVRGGELSVCYETVAPFYNVVAIQHPLYISSKHPPLHAGGQGEGVAKPVKKVPDSSHDGSSKGEGTVDKELADDDDGTEALTDAVESIT